MAHAVRASMSIPIFFVPYYLRYSPAGGPCGAGGSGGPDERATATLSDGGLLSNFPIWLFDSEETPNPLPTLGFYLQPPGTAGSWPTRSLPQYLHALVATLLEGHDEYEQLHAHRERTIVIDTGTIKTTDFDLTPEQREWLYNSGRQAAKAFFQQKNLSDPGTAGAQ